MYTKRHARVQTPPLAPIFGSIAQLRSVHGFRYRFRFDSPPPGGAGAGLRSLLGLSRLKHGPSFVHSRRGACTKNALLGLV